LAVKLLEGPPLERRAQSGLLVRLARLVLLAKLVRQREDWGLVKG
jgi:hypothetical protein